jgi:hypothetical protein
VPGTVQRSSNSSRTARLIAAGAFRSKVGKDYSSSSKTKPAAVPVAVAKAISPSCNRNGCIAKPALQILAVATHIISLRATEAWQMKERL